jgi:hypothetical protein
LPDVKNTPVTGTLPHPPSRAAANWGDECPIWVKSGKAQSEQMLSALPAIADIGRAFLNVRVVPIGDIGTHFWTDYSDNMETRSGDV